MIYHIFIYQSNKPPPLWQKSICTELSVTKSEWISSVIGGITTIIEQTLNKNLEDTSSISMGKYSLQFIPLPNLGFHLVFFLDASDIPDLLQVSHRLIRVVSTHSRILSGIYKDTEKFATFDSHFFKILAENKRFFIISVHEVDQGTFFEEFLRLLPEVLKAEKETLLNERSSLEFRLRSPLNFVEKRNILLQLQKICQPLKDRNGIQNYTQQLKGLIKEIDDTKFRVIFLLKQAKETINTSI